METRANFILVGAFTLLGIIGALGFFLWLAKVQVDRQYETYGILFEDVSGLDASGAVLFNGIPVGRVIGLAIYPKDPSRVLATVEIDATTPVRQNTVAQLMSQGVTGVSYISLAGGTGDAPLLTAAPGELPIIRSRRSTVQALVQDAPDLLAQATELLGQLQALVSPENQAHVTSILSNVEQASGSLDEALKAFSDVTRTVSEASDQISRFTATLDTIGTSVTTTLANADTTLDSATGAFDEAKRVMETSASGIDSAAATFAAAEALMRDRVPGIVDKVSQAVTTINTAITDLSARSATTLGGFDKTSGLLNARLAELEQTLTDAEGAFTAVTEASDSFDQLVDGDGTALVAEMRSALASVNAAVGRIETVIDEDVPAVVADIRAAVATGSQAIERVAADVTGFTGSLGPLKDDAQDALTSATAIFDRATTTLDSIEHSLSVADEALTAATTTFQNADNLLDTDLGPVLGDIRSASERIASAAAQVSQDMPAITADLQALIGRADAVVGQVQTAVAGAAPGLSDFASRGLPELSRLAAEARGLVRSMNDVVRRIGSDPGRLLLKDRVPEYRR